MKIRIILFIIIVLAGGWLGKIIDLILAGQSEGQSLGLLIWMIIPLITSVFLAVAKNSEYKKLGLKPHLKGNGKWYFISFVTFPVIAILCIGIGLVTKSIDLTYFEIRGFVSTLFSWFLYNFFRSIFEETAWRGFLQERLIYLKVNDWLIYLTTATVWTLWHIPYYLFFYNGNSVMRIVSCFTILFSWSILYAEIYRITRSIWPCVLLHATSNAIQFTMLKNYLIINEKMEFIISPTGGILACASSIILGLIIRKHRLNREKIKLNEFRIQDIKLFNEWLNKDYIKKWYTDAEDWLKEVSSDEYDFIHHFIVAHEEKPIGFCQYYDYTLGGEDWHGKIDIKDTYSIDYLIGEKEYLGKGFGTKIVKYLTNKVFEETTAIQIIVQPEKDNIASRNTLLSAGYSYDDENDILIIKRSIKAPYQL